MSSRLDLSLQLKTLLLILLLFSAGASLPLNAIRDFAKNRTPSVTGLFLSLLIDLIRRPSLLSSLYQHSNASGNILKYFEQAPNAEDSYFWLQNRAALFTLLSDGATLNVLGEAPWLFHVIRVIDQTYPRQYAFMLQNRTLFNAILGQVALHTEFRTLFTYHPEFLPLIFNLTSTSPRAAAWLQILSPAPLSTFSYSNQITVEVFILSTKPIQTISVQLLNSTDVLETYTGPPALIFNATITIQNLPNGPYGIVATLTLTNGSTFSSSIIVFQQNGATQTISRGRTAT